MKDLQRTIKRSEKEFDVLSSSHSKHKVSEKWNLFLVGSLGRMRALSLGFSVFLLGIVCLLSIFLGVFVWRHYQFEWIATKNVEIEIQQKEIDDLRKSNERLMAKLATLEAGGKAVTRAATLEKIQEYPEEIPQEVLEETSEEISNEETAEDVEIEIFPSVPLDEKPFPMPETGMQKSSIIIDKYSALAARGEYVTAFTITKIKDPETPVSGYIVAVLVPRNRQDSFLAAPAMKVVEGIPATPAKGQPFSIRKIKNIRLSFATSNLGKFRTCRIFVFDEDGNIMLVEEHDI